MYVIRRYSSDRQVATGTMSSMLPDSSVRPSATTDPGTREHFLSQLARDWPDELARYRSRYSGRAYLPDEERKAMRERLAALKQSLPSPRVRVPLIEPPAAPEQLDLAI